MSMFSEITTESVIGVVVRQIKQQLETVAPDSEAAVKLKNLGRFALQQFEWSTPDWAAEYDELFKE